MGLFDGYLSLLMVIAIVNLPQYREFESFSVKEVYEGVCICLLQGRRKEECMQERRRLGA